MAKHYMIMLRIASIISKMKNDKNIESRKVDYVGLKTWIEKLNNLNPEGSHMEQKASELLQYVKWLAHIDHPGHDDKVYIEGIDKAVRELHAPSGVIFRENAEGKVRTRIERE